MYNTYFKQLFDSCDMHVWDHMAVGTSRTQTCWNLYVKQHLNQHVLTSISNVAPISFYHYHEMKIDMTLEKHILLIGWYLENYNPSNNKVCISCDIMLDELTLWYASKLIIPTPIGNDTECHWSTLGWRIHMLKLYVKARLIIVSNKHNSLWDS